MKYLKDNCVFYKMTPELVAKCGEFSCSKSKDIDDFFHKEYSLYEEAAMCVSYCFVHKVDKKLVAAFALSMTSITVKDSRVDSESIQSAINPNLTKNHYPAALLGQLAVFDGYNGMNLSAEVINFIKTELKLCDSNSFIVNNHFNNIGCRFIKVDAVNHPKVIKIYEEAGFKPIFLNKAERRTNISEPKTKGMFFDLYQIKI